MSLSHSLHLSLSLSPFNSVNDSGTLSVSSSGKGKILIVKDSPLHPPYPTSFFLKEGVLVVDGSCPPSFPLLALHPFQLEERWIPIAFLTLLRPTAGSSSSRGLSFAPSVLRWGWGRRASRRQRWRWWLGRTTGSAGQV